VGACPHGVGRSGSVHLRGRVDLYVLGPSVETEPRQFVQGLSQRLFLWTRDHEVNVRDSNVVPPYVYLFHT
jgi:hypothetical protein